MQPIEEKGHHIEVEAVLRAVKIQGIVPDKQGCDLPWERQENQEPEHRNSKTGRRLPI